jgi:hypothetical protein
VDAPDPGLARRIAEVLDAAVPHPWIGRQLFGLFGASEGMEQAGRAETFLAANLGFIVVGRKP